MSASEVPNTELVKSVGLTSVAGGAEANQSGESAVDSFIEVDGRLYLSQGRVRLFVQRAFDLLLLLISLPLVLPLFLVIAVLIKIDSRGPVFFRQERVGLHRHRFLMWKFRKMQQGVKSSGPMVTVRHDRRLTRIGSVLERTKLDELPQLLNVLDGTMSIVGPRPDVPKFVEYFPEGWDVVLSVKPGIFGASQNYFRNESELYPPVDVERFYVDNILPKMLELDTEYARRPGLLRDLGLLVEGVTASIFGAITSRTIVMRRSQVASFLALSAMGVLAMLAAIHATGIEMPSQEGNRALWLAAVVTPVLILLLQIPKAVATSMTFTDLRRMLWAVVAIGTVIAAGMWGFHDLQQLGLTLVVSVAFFLSFLFVYKLTVYSFYLTFFVQDSRVFARRAILAAAAFGPLSVFLVVTANHGPRVWLGPDALMHATTVLLAFLVRPLVALHFRPEPFHTSNSSRFVLEVGRLVLATIAGSSTMLLSIILARRQTPAFVDLLFDGAVFLVAFTVFSLRESRLAAPLREAGRPVEETPHVRRRVIVVGSGIELTAYVAALDGIPEHDFAILGVVTPETSRRLSTVGGHRVLGATNDLAAIVESTAVDQIVVLESSLDSSLLGSLEAVAHQFGCEYFLLQLFPGAKPHSKAPSSEGARRPFTAALRRALSVGPDR